VNNLTKFCFRNYLRSSDGRTSPFPTDNTIHKTNTTSTNAIVSICYLLIKSST